MSEARKSSEFWRGVRDQLPLQLGVAPFGLVFGVLGIASGLSEWQTILMSAIVFGGASQVVFAQLWMSGAAPWVVGGSVAVINARHILYSVSVAPYLSALPLRWRIMLGYLLTDEAFAVSIHRFEGAKPDQPVHYHLLGSGLTLWVCWQLSTIFGVQIGATLPPYLNLEFAIPLTFLAIVVPRLRHGPEIAAALCAGLVALVGQDLPWNFWIIVAAVAGIGAGACVDWIRGRL